MSSRFYENDEEEMRTKSRFYQSEDFEGELGNVTIARRGYLVNSSEQVVKCGDFQMVSSGGTMSGVTIEGWGHLWVSSGASVHDIKVCSGGEIFVLDGGTATNIVAEEAAILGIDVSPETHVQGTFAGSAFDTKDGRLSGFVVTERDCITILDGGMAFDTVIEPGGQMNLYSGGIASNTHVRGKFFVSSAAEAHGVVISSGGQMGIYGGLADGVMVSRGGVVHGFGKVKGKYARDYHDDEEKKEDGN